MVGKVRTPLDEYQAAQRRSPILKERRARMGSAMPRVESAFKGNMSTEVQPEPRTGKPMKGNQDKDWDTKVKGTYSEPM